MLHRSVPAVWLLVCASVTWATSADSGGIHAVFKASDGDTIELDTRTGAFRAPRSQGAKLEECSDAFQTCVTDTRDCLFHTSEVAKIFRTGVRLRFPQQIVSVVHNHVWTVSDAAAYYLFHSVIDQGVVGISVGPTPSFDFRDVFRNPKFRPSGFEALEYRIVGSDGILACRD